MTGVSIVGDSINATRARPTSLPAEARSLCRMLRLLKSPDLALEILLQSLATLPLKDSSNFVEFCRSHVHETLSQSSDWREPEYTMALTLDLAINLACEKGKMESDDHSDSGESHEPTHEETNGPFMMQPRRKNSGTRHPTATTTSETPEARVAVVSDTSSAESSTEETPATKNVANGAFQAPLIKEFWATLLEYIHLQVSARTTRVWGRKKIYEIYQLTGPAVVEDVESIRGRLGQEFLSVFSGCESRCQAYATRFGTGVYLQLCIGEFLDLQDERNRSCTGEKKKKRGNEYIAVVTPGTPLIALTASRAASKSRFTPFVLEALNAVLAKTRSFAPGEGGARRFGDYAGTEPHDLLKAAHARFSGQAVGRFASYAAAAESNPVDEMFHAATGDLFSRPIGEQERLKVGATMGRHAAQLFKRVHDESNGAAEVVAAHAGSTIVDYAAGAKQGRKRARIRDLGDDGIRVQRMCWKWSGQTTAASACWMKEQQTDDLDKTDFKCAVVFQGPDVHKGLQALMDAGLAESPLPDFVRDAPVIGSAVTVNQGTISVGDSDSFAPV